jgi:agmatine/peptidylarginine deiminase
VIPLPLALAAAVAAPRVLMPTPNTRVLLPDIAVTAWQRADDAPARALLVVYGVAFQDAVARIARAAAGEVDVLLLAPPAESDAAHTWLADEGVPAALWPVPLNSPWIRDYAPLEKRDRRDNLTWLDTRYNPARPDDDALPAHLARYFDVPLKPLAWSLEGGGLIADGRGLCAMTWSSFVATGWRLEDSRAWSDALARGLGCAALVVVPALGSERTGHIDLVAQFVSPGGVMVASVEPGAVDAAGLDEAAAALGAGARALGRAIEATRVPLPLGADGTPFSYINGTRVGGRFIVPHYDGVAPAQERAAYDALGHAMPGVTLAPVTADGLLEFGGAVHCVT